MVRQLAEHRFDAVGPPFGPRTGGGPLSDGVADGPARGVSSVGGRYGVAPVRVAVAPVGEQGVGVEPGSFQQVSGVVDLHNRYATVEVGSDIVGFGWWRVVGVAADVAVEVVVSQIIEGDNLRKAVDIGKVPVGGGDLLLVAGAQMVLGPTLAVVPVGVDEQHLAPPLRRFGALGTQDQDRRGNAGAVEQVRAETDNGVKEVVFDDPPADGPFGAASEQHTVWHDRRYDAVAFDERPACVGGT